MIQNPNVFIRNFDDMPKSESVTKYGKVHTGAIAEGKVFSYSNISQMYMIIRADVTVVGTSFIEAYQTRYTDSVPILYNLSTKEKVDRFKFDKLGEHILYADISAVKDFKLALGVGDGLSETDIYITFSDALPHAHTDIISTITSNLYNVTDDSNKGLFFRYSEGLFDSKQKPLKINRSKRWLILKSEGSYGNGIAKNIFIQMIDSNGNIVYPDAYSQDGIMAIRSDKVNPSLKLPDDGSVYLIYDMFSLPTEVADIIRVTPSSSLTNDVNYRLNISYVGFTNEIDNYVKKQEIRLNNGNYTLVKESNCIACWGSVQVRHSSGAEIFVIKKGDEKPIIVDIKSILGVHIGQQTYTHLIPFSTSKTNNNNSGIGLVFKVYDADKYYFCDVTTSVKNTLVSDNWKEVKFWEKIGTNRRIPSKDASASGIYRYDTTLPDDYYNKTMTTDKLIEYQGVQSLRSLGPMAVSKKMVCLAQYDTNGARCNVWATTDGGANFVSLLDFGTIYKYIKVAEEIPYINTSSFPSYSGGMQLYKVTPTYPSQANKDPQHLITLTGKTIDSISSESKCVVTSPSHGLITGDLVCFVCTDVGTWSQISNNVVSESNLGYNIYFVEKIDTDRFYIKYYNGSYDNILPCRHIHSVNECIDGFLVATGEIYPEGWIYMIQQQGKDEAHKVDVTTTKYNSYRLNSSEEGVQRACGLITTQETQPELFFFSDDSFLLTSCIDIDGRPSSMMPTISSNGIWRGKLKDVDDITKFERVCDIPEPMIWVYRIGNMILGYGQLGGLVVSYDLGETWDYIGTIPIAVEQFNGIFNGAICIGNGYVLKYSAQNPLQL